MNTAHNGALLSQKATRRFYLILRRNPSLLFTIRHKALLIVVGMELLILPPVLLTIIVMGLIAAAILILVPRLMGQVRI